MEALYSFGDKELVDIMIIIWMIISLLMLLIGLISGILSQRKINKKRKKKKTIKGSLELQDGWVIKIIKNKKGLPTIITEKLDEEKEIEKVKRKEIDAK